MMKYFLRGLRKGLCFGFPLIAFFLLFLPVNQGELIPEYEQPPAVTEQPEEFPSVSEEETEETAEKDSVILSFAGDVQFSEQYLTAYDQSGISAFADDELLNDMRNADLFMLNHEFSFSQRGEAMADKQYTFRTDPKYVTILQELGADIAGIANNHILDFGEAALLDTLDTLEKAEISHVGAGRNLSEASAPCVKEINGQTFAFFAATRVSPSAGWYASDSRPGVFQTYDPKRLNAAISEAEKNYDHIIVFVHWGIERNEFPEEYQRSLARGYIDSGADLVIGCHPHILQGFEYYQGVPVIYSLGNFLFGNRTDETVLLNAEFSKDGALRVRLIPCQRKNGVLSEISDPDKLYRHLSEISHQVTISEDGVLIP